jgi:hypothetical protein
MTAATIKSGKPKKRAPGKGARQCRRDRDGDTHQQPAHSNSTGGRFGSPPSETRAGVGAFSSTPGSQIERLTDAT